MTKLTIDQALQRGIEAHKAGQVQEADRLYTAILQVQPKHPDANHNMGVLAVDVGKVQEALPFFKTALEANPAIMQFWLSYIDTLIKLNKFVDAKAVFDQATSKGAKGEVFDQLEQRLNVSSGVPVESLISSQETEQIQSNTLDTLKLDQAINLAKKKAKDGSPEDAIRIYQDILVKFPKNNRAIDGIKRLPVGTTDKTAKAKDLPKDQMQSLINLYTQGKLKQTLEESIALLQRFPNACFLYNIRGIVFRALGQLDASIEAYTKALTIKPDYVEAYYNMGNVLKEQGKLEEATETYNKAVDIKPDYFKAYGNIGVTLEERGKLEEAIEAYSNALAIKPDYAEAYNNMGNTLRRQGKLEEALETYNEALIIKPDYADA
ncbi:tetratricopeptide repeat protein [Planktomarina temperata]|nr:tetratricopeptide repeat protein [Planktomarina temperata]